MIIMQWVVHDLDIFNTPLLNEIQIFAKSLSLDAILNWAPIGPNMLKNIEDQAKRNSSSVPNHFDHIPLYTLAESLTPSRIALVYEPQQVAAQLTLIDMEIYKLINPKEIFEKKWSKPCLHILSRNVLDMIKRVNLVSDWVATEILLQQKLAARVTMMKQMLQIAQHLLKFGSFNSFMGIMMAFEVSCISRLKLTFLELNKSKKNGLLLKTFQDICTPLRSFKNLRDQMAARGETTLTIPYIGLFLNDYTVIDEKSPDFVNKNLVNLHKWQQLLNSVHNLLKNQKFLANTPLVCSEPLYTLLHSLPSLSEAELFMLSEIREPKSM